MPSLGTRGKGDWRPCAGTGRVGHPDVAEFGHRQQAFDPAGRGRDPRALGSGQAVGIFDARLSDYIEETINGLKFKIRFLRVNERHHTIAIASMNRLPLNPIRTRVQHCNVQVADLNDMTLAYQRVKQLGFDMTLSVGQHTNDKELSFYAMTPSGFEWELGWNPIVVDEST